MAAKTAPTTVMLKRVRLAFLHAFEPQAGMDGGKAKYSVNCLMAPDHESIAPLKDAIRKVAQAKWKDESKDTLKALKAGDRICLRDGVLKKKFAGFDGNMFVAASNANKPSIFNRKGEMITQGCEGTPYSGCWANVSVEIWAQDNNYGQRINCSLSGIQFVEDGEAFAGGTIAKTGDFEDLGEGSDDTTELSGNSGSFDGDEVDDF